MFASVTVKIQPIPLEEHLRFVAFSDASFASEKVPDSHQGMLIMASHKDIGDNKNSPVNPIVWHSKKIQKWGQYTFSRSDVAGRSSGHFVMGPTVLDLVARWEMQLAIGR